MVALFVLNGNVVNLINVNVETSQMTLLSNDHKARKIEFLSMAHILCLVNWANFKHNDTRHVI